VSVVSPGSLFGGLLTALSLSSGQVLRGAPDDVSRISETDGTLYLTRSLVWA
jgi:hypothetical protein